MFDVAGVITKWIIHALKIQKLRSNYENLINRDSMPKSNIITSFTSVLTMTLLALDSTRRDWLIKRQSLAFDDEQYEIFLGLTHEESVFFAAAEHLAMGRQNRSDEDLLRFLVLFDRHELARTYAIAMNKVMGY